MKEIKVQHNGEVLVDDDMDADGELFIEVAANGVYATPEQCKEIIATIAEAAGLDGVPASAVKAKDVPLNEALIRVAAAHNATISFRYAKGPGQPVEARSFAPKSVKVLPDHVTFVGYDEDRGGMRSFRSDRIKGLVAVNV